MSAYTNSICTLQFPRHYVPITEEEMTYIEGGYTFLCDEVPKWHKIRRSAWQTSVDICAGILAAGWTNTTAGAVAIAKLGATKCATKVKSILGELGILGVVSVAAILELEQFTVGYWVAKFADKFDRGGEDGWIEYYGF